MKSVQIDEDIVRFLQSKAEPGEPLSDVLRRELQLRTVEIDDDLYAYLLSRAVQIGESASDILRRELEISPDDDGHGGGQEPTIVSFHIEAGTDAKAWNSPDDPVIATVGDTLRIVNDDAVAHRLHTDGGVPFAHPASDVQPGGSADYVLTAPFASAPGHTLYDHDHGVDAAFWLTVLAKA